MLLSLCIIIKSSCTDHTTTLCDRIPFHKNIFVTSAQRLFFYVVLIQKTSSEKKEAASDSERTMPLLRKPSKFRIVSSFKLEGDDFLGDPVNVKRSRSFLSACGSLTFDGVGHGSKFVDGIKQACFVPGGDFYEDFSENGKLTQISSFAIVNYIEHFTGAFGKRLLAKIRKELPTTGGGDDSDESTNALLEPRLVPLSDLDDLRELLEAFRQVVEAHSASEAQASEAAKAAPKNRAQKAKETRTLLNAEQGALNERLWSGAERKPGFTVYREGEDTTDDDQAPPQPRKRRKSSSSASRPSALQELSNLRQQKMHSVQERLKVRAVEAANERVRLEQFGKDRDFQRNLTMALLAKQGIVLPPPPQE